MTDSNLLLKMARGSSQPPQDLARRVEVEKNAAAFQPGLCSNPLHTILVELL